MKSDIDIEKSRLRAFFKDLKPSASSEAIVEKFCATDAYISAESVLLYASLPSEPDTSKILQKALSDGKKVYFPKVEGKGIMSFYRVYSVGDLEKGAYGISEPVGCEKFENTETSVCAVPGLSFDKEGYRLGFGGGFYDRFLVSFRGKTVGLCFSAALSESLPRDRHDVAVGTVITEE